LPTKPQRQRKPDLFTFYLGEKRTPSLGMIRRRRERARTPNDFGEFDRFVLAEAEEACRRRAEMTGYAWSVDHMIPLARGGEHAWHNVQVIPAKLNQWKGRRMLLTEPGEWAAYLPGADLPLFGC